MSRSHTDDVQVQFEVRAIDPKSDNNIAPQGEAYTASVSITDTDPTSYPSGGPPVTGDPSGSIFVYLQDSVGNWQRQITNAPINGTIDGTFYVHWLDESSIYNPLFNQRRITIGSLPDDHNISVELGHVPSTFNPTNASNLDLINQGYETLAAITDPTTPIVFNQESSVLPTNTYSKPPNALKFTYVAEPAAVPAKVTGLNTTVNATTSKVTLNWNAVTGATSYNLYFSTDDVIYTNFSDSLTNPVTNAPFTTEALPTGTYYYKVSAVNSAGEGPKSDKTTANILGPLLPPTNIRVTNAVTTGNIISQVTLEWDAVTPDPTTTVSYNVSVDGTDVVAAQGILATSFNIVFTTPIYIGTPVVFGVSTNRNLSDNTSEKSSVGTITYVSNLDPCSVGDELGGVVTVVGSTIFVNTSNLDFDSALGVFTSCQTLANKIIVTSDNGVSLAVKEEVKQVKYTSVTISRNQASVNVSEVGSLNITDLNAPTNITYTDSAGNSVTAATVTKNNKQYNFAGAGGYAVSPSVINEGDEATVITISKGTDTIYLRSLAVNPLLLHRLGTSDLLAENLILRELFDEFVSQQLESLLPVLNINNCSEKQYNVFLRQSSRWAKYNSSSRFQLQVVLQNASEKVLMHTNKTASTLDKAQTGGISGSLKSNTHTESVTNGEKLYSSGATITEYGVRVGVDSTNLDGVLILRIIE